MEDQIVINNTKVIIKIGDITEENVDAIVNAANSSLMGGGGVDGAIHSKGGKHILEECKKIRETIYPEGLPTGKAIITTAGNLPSKYVIHTVGPICNGNWNKNLEKQLYNAFYNSLELAKGKNLKSIAIPFISAGAYRCPKEKVATTAKKAVIDFIKSESSLDEIRFVLFSKEDFNIFIKSFKR